MGWLPKISVYTKSHKIKLQAIDILASCVSLFFGQIDKKLYFERNNLFLRWGTSNVVFLLSQIFYYAHSEWTVKDYLNAFGVGNEWKSLAYLFAENGNIFAEGIWWAYIATGNAGFAGCTCREFTFLEY